MLTNTETRDFRPFLARLAPIAGAAILITSAAAQDTVQYAFEFVAEWSEETHPGSLNFPANPHFSPVVGTVHTRSASIWEPGGIASPGIEQMAETGASSILNAEIQTLVLSQQADRFLNLGGVGISPGARIGTFSATDDFPAVSLVTMIAPSPDWFVGVHGVDLRPDGVWAREIIIDLDAYDSGTDAGVDYLSGNANIPNHIPIANIAAEFPFLNGGRIGTFRFTLTSDAACSLADIAEPYNTLDLSDITAFIDAFTGSQDAGDLDGNEIFDLADITAFVNAFTAGCP